MRFAWVVVCLMSLAVGGVIAAALFPGAVPAALPSARCQPTMIHIGMKEADVLTACGEPERRNYGQYGHLHLQMVYRVWTPSFYVYTEDGVVTSFQWSE